MPPGQVFISYRRDDTAGYARALGDELAQQLGADRVFMDVDDIQPGQPFAQVIQHQVGAATVLLVLIGKRWLGEREGMPPRIDDPSDFVRREVASGLVSSARVIPVLLDGAAMPTESQLPEELRALAGRHALAVDNARYVADTSRLLRAVREALGGSVGAAEGPTMARRKTPSIAVTLLIVAVWAVVEIAGFGIWSRRAGGSADAPVGVPGSPAASATAARLDINGPWQAQVCYDWPNAHYLERFDFRGEAAELRGTASFLGVPRGVLEGRVEAGELRFVTRTMEVARGDDRETVHRYRGRWVSGELRFEMQTDDGSSAHVPVEFVARRATASAASASASASR